MCEFTSSNMFHVEWIGYMLGFCCEFYQYDLQNYIQMPFLIWSMYSKIHDQLKEINFDGTISLCGYGEPMLHKDIAYIVKKLSSISTVEIITNGDVLSPKNLQELYISNVSKVLISMYDGPEQIEKFKEMTKKANVPEDMVILRDRWYDKQNDFGVKLTNRAGTISVGDQDPINKHSSCYYPTYQFLIDWNGDIFLCPQDWQRRVSMGNLMQETVKEIWVGKTFTKFRNIVNKFLDANLFFLGGVPRSKKVQNAIIRKLPIVLDKKAELERLAFQRIAKKIIKAGENKNNGIRFFSNDQ